MKKKVKVFTNVKYYFGQKLKLIYNIEHLCTDAQISGIWSLQSMTGLLAQNYLPTCYSSTRPVVQLGVGPLLSTFEVLIFHAIFCVLAWEF